MTDLLEQRIAAELRAELRRQDHTGRWLSERTGMSPSSVARWLKGTRSPGLNELDLMCQALELTVAELLHRVDVTGGYARTPVLVGADAASTVAEASAKSGTSDQKVRGSNPFGCTEQDIVPLVRKDRRRRGFVTPSPMYAELAQVA